MESPNPEENVRAPPPSKFSPLSFAKCGFFRAKIAEVHVTVAIPIILFYVLSVLFTSLMTLVEHCVACVV